MTLLAYSLENIRLFSHVECSPAHDFTVFYGDNGVGKTTLLEAVDFMSRGRTFRTRVLSDFLKHGQSEICGYATVENEDITHSIGVKKSKSESTIRVDKQNAKSVIELNRTLPVIAIHPECHQLIQGPPPHRRHYLDWGVFHVEPEFIKNWRLYHRALSQRNSLLRHNEINKRELAAWNEELSAYGSKVNQARHRHAQRLITIVQEINQTLLEDHALSMMYDKGWDEDIGLQEALEKHLGRDLQNRYTGVGPHRADLKLFFDREPAGRTCSRGQQKLVAIVLQLAQLKIFQAHIKRRCKVVLDDVTAELDSNRCQRLFALLAGVNAQYFISVIHPQAVDQFLTKQIKMFHVKPHSTLTLH